MSMLETERSRAREVRTDMKKTLTLNQWLRRCKRKFGTRREGCVAASEFQKALKIIQAWQSWIPEACDVMAEKIINEEQP